MHVSLGPPDPGTNIVCLWDGHWGAIGGVASFRYVSRVPYGTGVGCHNQVYAIYYENVISCCGMIRMTYVYLDLV